MKKCLILLIGLLPFLALAQPQPAAPAALDTNAAADQQYDIQIENGQLLIAPLKKRIDVKALYEGQGEPYSIPATIGNLVKYLRAANTNLNFVLSPGAADVTIGDLKFQSGNINALMQALNIATDGAVNGGPLIGRGFGAFGGRGQSDDNEWALTTTARKRESSTLEAFNLSGYIQTLGLGNTPNNPPPPAVIQKKVDEIQHMILSALSQLHPDSYSGGHDPVFRYHEGTHLLIVTGSPEAIEVTRKIVNALSGQQKYSRGVQEDLLLDIPPSTNQN